MRNGGNLKRPVKEWIVVIIVVAVSAGIVGYNYVRAKCVVNEKVLVAQLEQIRASVLLYRYINGKYPPDLSTLSHKRYAFPGMKKSVLYLNGIGTDGDKLVDPFGHEFVYDVKTGWVKPAANGYWDR